MTKKTELIIKISAATAAIGLVIAGFFLCPPEVPQVVLKPGEAVVDTVELRKWWEAQIQDTVSALNRSWELWLAAHPPKPPVVHIETVHVPPGWKPESTASIVRVRMTDGTLLCDWYSRLQEQFKFTGWIGVGTPLELRAEGDSVFARFEPPRKPDTVKIYLPPPWWKELLKVQGYIRTGIGLPDSYYAETGMKWWIFRSGVGYRKSLGIYAGIYAEVPFNLTLFKNVFGKRK